MHDLECELGGRATSVPKAVRWPGYLDISQEEDGEKSVVLSRDVVVEDTLVELQS